MSIDPNTRAGSQASELLMLRLRYKEGRLVRARGNSPVAMTEPETFWIVYREWVDVFLVPLGRDGSTGTRRHLLRAVAGQAIFALPCRDAAFVVLAAGGPDTELLQVHRSMLTALAGNPQYVDQIIELTNGWVSSLSEALAAQSPPQGMSVLEPGKETVLADQQVAQPNRDVLWVRHLEGRSHLMGIDALAPLGVRVFPLTNRTWLHPIEASRVRSVNTRALVEQGELEAGLDSFHQLALASIVWSAERSDRVEQEQHQRRRRADAAQFAGALSDLAGVLGPRSTLRWHPQGAEIDSLLAASEWVGQAMGIAIQAPPRDLSQGSGQDPLRRIARASRIRIRQVALEGRWYREDHGPLLGYESLTCPVPAGGAGRARGGDTTEVQPVALLPLSRRPFWQTERYEMLNPAARTRTLVSDETASALLPVGYQFYPPLPDQPVTGMDLLRLGLRDGERDLVTLVLAGLVVGALGMVAPLLTGMLFDTILPGMQKGALVQVALALLVSAVVTVMLQVTRNIAVLRLESRLDATVETAIWDRLLRLPVRFFRQYTAGDLADRILGLSTVRQILSEAVIYALLSGIFSLFNLALLFTYAPALAWQATGMIALVMSITWIAGTWLLRRQRALGELRGRASGLVLQLVTGIAKLRVANAEERAFARWATLFSRQRQAALKARSIASGLQVFNVSYPVVVLLALFASVALARGDQAGLSTGAFLAFYTAFIQVLTASLAFSTAWMHALSAVPIYERIKPILHALPEVDLTKADPGTLTGAIELSHVAFRYREDEPLVLNDVSLHIKPGEFVALVGASGCGKSTLLRLLLKFESPDAGAIYYDGQDLERLDAEAVRRQIGTVLQDGKLVAGSILTNIIGSSLLTADDAWDAVRSVGLDQDIQQMPMGLQTVLSDSGANLSGGQRQRLLIARAIVNKPRLLFLDEATSALDNPNQALVSAGLERLSATRVVVAHRLTTIMNADRIYVLDKGQIVQTGTYTELMGERGPFAALARRQTL